MMPDCVFIQFNAEAIGFPSAFSPHPSAYPESVRSDTTASFTYPESVRSDTADSESINWKQQSERRGPIAWASGPAMRFECGLKIHRVIKCGIACLKEFFCTHATSLMLLAGQAMTLVGSPRESPLGIGTLHWSNHGPWYKHESVSPRCRNTPQP